MDKLLYRIPYSPRVNVRYPYLPLLIRYFLFFNKIFAFKGPTATGGNDSGDKYPGRQGSGNKAILESTINFSFGQPDMIS